MGVSYEVIRGFDAQHFAVNPDHPEVVHSGVVSTSALLKPFVF